MRYVVALVLVLLVVALYLGWFRFSTQRHLPDDGKVTVGVEVDVNKVRSDTEAARDRASDLGKNLRENVARTETAKGKIVDVQSVAQRFTLATPEGKELTIYLGPSTQIRVKDRAAPLHELRAGDRITVVYQVEEGKNQARSVVADPAT